MQQDDVAIEFWGWADEIPFQTRAPHTGRWLPRFAVPRTRFPALLRMAMWSRSIASSAAAIHITDPSALVIAGPRPVMTTVYDLIPMHHANSAQPPGYRDYVRKVQSAAKVFAISQATADDVKATLSVPQDRVVVARPGVEVPEVSTSAPPLQGKYFMYVGSPDPHKNVEVLIQAMRLIPEVGERLIVAGNWPQHDVSELLSRAENDPLLRGRIDHLGYVDAPTLLSLYRYTTAVVTPSLIEGFGLPVAEALAAGAPVVHSRLPVLEEVSAGCALTFSPTSAAELATCLSRISSDSTLRQDLKTRGRRRAESLTWKEALERTIDAYRAAIDREGRN